MKKATAHDRLTAIPVDRAAQQSTLVEALNNRLAGDLRLRAQIADTADAPAWIAFEQFHLAPLLADGAIPLLTDAQGRVDAAAAAVALAALEPVVAAIELVVGHSLLPTAVVASPPDAGTTLLIEAQAEGQTLHRLLLVADPALAIAPAASLPIDPATIVHVAPAWTAQIAGPALRRARRDGIGEGDLFLLGTGHPLARFSPPGRTGTLACRLDVQGGMMTVEQVLEREDEVSTAAPPPPSADGDAGATLAEATLAEATVPITVEFDGGGLTLERLAALGTGSVVSIPDAVGGTLNVRLRADDRIVANGELVAVGDGYGVLITTVTGPEAKGA